MIHHNLTTDTHYGGSDWMYLICLIVPVWHRWFERRVKESICLLQSRFSYWNHRLWTEEVAWDITAVLIVLSLRACSSPPVSENWRRLLDEWYKGFKKLKQVRVPTIQHLELPWPGCYIVTMFNYWSCSLYAVRSEGYHLSFEHFYPLQSRMPDLTIARVNVMKLYFKQYQRF